MKFKLAASSFFLALGFIVVNGCAADTSADDDDSAASQDEITAASKRFNGAFVHGASTSQPTSFTGLVFNADGTFFADGDTGIRCITAPCPSSAHLEGKFTATKNYVHLNAKAGAAASDFYGRYRYTLTDAGLSLSRTDFAQSMDKETSYCAEATDCGAQGLIHPMCAPGGWTCGASKANTCSFHCGGLPVDDGIWPASATKLVAENRGGGFTPPAPAGSECGIGQATYTLDRATRAMTAVTCELAAAGKPLTKKTSNVTITKAELTKIESALASAKISSGDLCGADKPYLDIQVTTPTSTKTYSDSFYSCQGGSKTYIDGIDAVLSALSDANN